MKILLHLERALIGVGTALLIWCAVMIGEARYYDALPIPPPAARQVPTLPGESSSAVASPTRGVAPGVWIARLEAPAVHLSATVLEGSEEVTLSRAAGHIEGTALPGDAGNVGVAGHRDTIFRPVRNLQSGDALLLTTPERVYRYRISATSVVEPEDVSVL